ncbi:hypothetical protein LCGC14_1528350 [marine sediment metagenome]|uniref:Uncharacterized protein n=1 Tax=marine sediment metagenome TaxID=412755 RepID=A0A0F9IX12_9ZZZZ
MISDLAKKIALMWFGKRNEGTKEFNAFVKHTNKLLAEVQVEDKVDGPK